MELHDFLVLYISLEKCLQYVFFNLITLIILKDLKKLKCLRSPQILREMIHFENRNPIY